MQIIPSLADASISKLAPKRRRRRMAELLAGKPFDMDDLPFLLQTEIDELHEWTSDADFLALVEKDKLRADHINRFRAFQSEITGLSMAVPTPILTEDLYTDAATRVRVTSYGYNFIDYVVKITIAFGEDFASRLVSIPKRLVRSWMHTEESHIKEARNTALAEFSNKATELINIYADELRNPTRIQNSGTKELAYAMAVLYDKSKDICNKSETPQAGGVTDNRSVYNIIMNNPAEKEKIVNAIVRRMGGELYQPEAPKPKQEIYAYENDEYSEV